jgi:DNA-directed RNA polymerase specialized sigma24 family protein
MRKSHELVAGSRSAEAESVSREVRAMDKAQFGEIMGKLDLVFRFLVMNLTRDLETQEAKILGLSAMRFKPAEISKILQLPLSSVTGPISRARKKAKIKEAQSREGPKDKS